MLPAKPESAAESKSRASRRGPAAGDHRHVESDRNVSVWDAKGLCEGRIGNCFATLLEDWAPEVPHGSALVEPHIEHGRSAGGSKAHREEAIRRMC